MIEIAIRVGDDHPLEHLVEIVRRAAIRDKIEAVFAHRPIRHAMPEDFQRFAVLLDRHPLDMGRRRLVLALEFNVVRLGPADNFLLVRDRNFFPMGKVMYVTLDGYLAAPRKLGLFLADHRHGRAAVALRIFGAIHKPDHIAAIAVPESGDLLDNGHA